MLLRSNCLSWHLVHEREKKKREWEKKSVTKPLDYKTMWIVGWDVSLGVRQREIPDLARK